MITTETAEDRTFRYLVRCDLAALEQAIETKCNFKSHNNISKIITQHGWTVREYVDTAGAALRQQLNK